MSTSRTNEAKAGRVEQMLRAGAETIERRDRETAKRQIGEFWHEDCEWSPLIAGVEGESTYHGREGVLQFFEDFLGSFDVSYRDIEFEQIGDAVVWLSTMSVRGRESGVEVDRELGVVYEFEGDLIRRGRAYESHSAALAAAKELANA